MEPQAGGSRGNLQLFAGDFQFLPRRKMGPKLGAKHPDSGPEWSRLGSARPGLGKVMPGGHWRTQGVGVGTGGGWIGAGIGTGRVIPVAECEKLYYEQVEGAAMVA